MRSQPICLLFLVSALTSTSQAEERSPLAVPPGAEITLTPSKDKWLLGENILLYYEVKNRGTKPFEVEAGGDYRGGTRSSRFKVAAFDEQGTLQEDLSPFQFDMGGFRGRIEIKPGESWFGNVPLMRYRTLANPGKYTIRVAHDLGWKGESLSQDGPTKDEAADPRWMETTIEVAMPTEEQAAKLVVEMVEMKDSGATFGKKREPYPDLTCLCYPVYLPLLIKLAKAQHLVGVEAIAAQFTPESTSALIDLLFLADDADARQGINKMMNERQSVWFEENETVSDAAARYLTDRIPDPPPVIGVKQVSGWSEQSERQREKRVAKSWRDEHAEPVLKYARHMLLNEPSSGMRDRRKENAVQILQRIGTKDDHAVVVEALDNALQMSHEVLDEFPESDDAREALHYGILFDLELCAKAMRIAPKENPATPAEIVVYLEAMRYEGETIPPEFHQFGPKWLKHEFSYVRRMTIEAIPRPIPAWVTPELPALMRSVNVGVRLEATEVVADSADAQFRDVIMERIKVEKDDWVLAALNRAAQKTGVPRDVLLEAWANRLGEPVYDRASQRFGTGAKSFEMLQTNVFEYEGGYGWSGWQTGEGSETLKKRWLEFIDTNRKELLAGKKYRVGDPELTEDLIPDGASITHEGKMWPPARPQK